MREHLRLGAGTIALIVTFGLGSQMAAGEPVALSAGHHFEDSLQQSAGLQTARAFGSSAGDSRIANQLLDRQPLNFVRNDGQVDPRVRYYAQRGGFASYFTKDAAVMVFPQAMPDGPAAGQDGRLPGAASGRAFALELTYVGGDREAVIEGLEQRQGHYNFLIGAEPAAWRREVPTYSGVVYRDLWPGIDMTFREEAGRLKYAFVVRPGADPSQIRLSYDGADGLMLRDDGALQIDTAMGPLVDERPVSFQIVDGRRTQVETAFQLAGGQASESDFGFALKGDYALDRTLVIDPGLVYATYLDGQNFDEVFAIAVDDSGNIVAVGRTDGGLIPFPTTPGAFDISHNGGPDAFVTKVSADGSSLVYSTFLGGNSIEQAQGVALDSLGQPVVVGRTNGGTFPTTAGAFDTTFNGATDAFVAKLSADGSSLLYSTFLAGSLIDEAQDVAIDIHDRPVVVGQTEGGLFPTTAGAFDTSHNGSCDAFITNLSADGSNLVYSTFLGSSSCEVAYGVALDILDRPVVVGPTDSGSIPFPTTPGAFDTSYNGNTDAFVTKLSSDGSSLVYSTFLGGSSLEQVFDVALDGLDQPVVVGSSFPLSPFVPFPTTPGAFDSSPNGRSDAFVSKLSADGASLEYSTLFGGDEFDIANTVAVDSLGRPVVGGETLGGSIPFPTTPGAFDTTYNGVRDGFITTLSDDFSSLVDSSFLGGSDFDRVALRGDGIALDAADNIYVGGIACSEDFPTTAGTFQEVLVRPCGGFVAKFGISNSPPVADAGPPQEVECTSPEGAQVTLDGSGSSDPDGDPLTFDWSNTFGTASGVMPVVNLALGRHEVDLLVTDPGGLTDMASVVVDVLDTTPPGLVASLAPVGGGDEDDDGDEGRFEIGFSATDACDAEPEVIATLVSPGCPDTPVDVGQIVEFELEDDDCELETEDGILEIEGSALILRAMATDATENSSTSEVRATGLGSDDDDDDDAIASADLDD